MRRVILARHLALWLLVLLTTVLKAETPVIIALGNGDSLQVSVTSVESWGVWLTDGRVVRYNVMKSMDTDDEELAAQVESSVEGVISKNSGPMRVHLDFGAATYPVHQKYVEKPGFRPFMMYGRTITKRPELFGIRFRYNLQRLEGSMLQAIIVSGRKTVTTDGPDDTRFSRVYQASGGELALGWFFRQGSYEMVSSLNLGVYSVSSRVQTGVNQTSSESMVDLNFPVSLALELHNYLPSRQFAVFFGLKFYANNLDIENNDGRLAATFGFGLALN